ncbi:hypothetical protein [Propionivibrio sp.]|uniref:hypothetical protein n=1 Tax=Propionivibrio sp. TaxID=2212460 RepID=UPI0025F5E37A|nr:hypothetical protein [Propionivibrio sp.]
MAPAQFPVASIVRFPRAERDGLLADVDQTIAWSRDAVHLVRRLHKPTLGCMTNKSAAPVRTFFRSSAQGAGIDFYDGTLRVRAPTADHRRWCRCPELPAIDPRRGQTVELHEVSLLTARSAPRPLVQGGPLARVQNCDFIPSPLAEAGRRVFVD